jgi:cytochrome c oxidase subunit 2
MFLIGALASVVGIALGLVINWFPPEATEQSAQVDLLYDVTLAIAVPIFVLVMTVAIYSVVRFRVRPGDESDGAPIHGNSRLEVLWVLIPFLIVSALSAYAWVGLHALEEEKPNALRVNVIGQQFAWKFEYPSEGGMPAKQTTDLVLPVGRPVQFELNSEDVIHSFWVPAFRLKQDVVPGITTSMRLTPSQVGNYPVVCTELCGIGHATMRQAARVVPASSFVAWRSTPDSTVVSGGAPGAEIADGRRLFQGTGCAGCHSLGAAGSAAATGPPLGGLVEVAPRRKPGVSVEEYVRESILDPKAVVVPGYSPEGMPANYSRQLSPREVDALVNYLSRTHKETEGKPQ